MRAARTWALAGLAFMGATAAALARAEIVEMRFDDPTGRQVHTATLAPGKFLEICGPLALRQRVDWQFAAAAPLDFNIHYHQGKDVVFPAQLKQARSASDTLVVALAQDYCWMWTNRSKAPVQLTATLQRGG